MLSVWSADTSLPSFPKLNGDMTKDVVVIGGGIAGILTAYLLTAKGLDVSILEATKVAAGVTKNTTAKITAQHGLIYDKLITDFGEDKARMYAMANLQAIEKYKELINKLSLDCDFELLPSFMYALDKTKQDQLKAEYKAADKVGIKCSMENQSPLPFEVKGLLKFEGQAQFNPLKFIKGLLPSLNIYEDTMVKTVEDNRVLTEHGTVKAKHIVVATHFPFINSHGMYFLKLYQSISYVIALEGTPYLGGTYLDADEKGYAFRNYGNYLLLTGGDHRTGQFTSDVGFNMIRKAAQEFYPNAKEKFFWSTQDCMPIDGVPYIGHYSENTPDLYVATGFNKWGMTGSMAAAMLLSDMITGTENPHQEVFSPGRLKIKPSAKNIVEDVATSAAALVSQVFSKADKNVEELKNGEGGIVDYGGDKVGAYKDNNGELYLVTVKCPHLGCQLAWNADNLSWDCPCHGSSFDYQGNLIHNPAMEGIAYHK